MADEENPFRKKKKAPEKAPALPEPEKDNSLRNYPIGSKSYYNSYKFSYNHRNAQVAQPAEPALDDGENPFKKKKAKPQVSAENDASALPPVEESTTIAVDENENPFAKKKQPPPDYGTNEPHKIESKMMPENPFAKRNDDEEAAPDDRPWYEKHNDQRRARLGYNNKGNEKDVCDAEAKTFCCGLCTTFKLVLFSVLLGVPLVVLFTMFFVQLGQVMNDAACPTQDNCDSLNLECENMIAKFGIRPRNSTRALGILVAPFLHNPCQWYLLVVNMAGYLVLGGGILVGGSKKWSWVPYTVLTVVLFPLSGVAMWLCEYEAGPYYGCSAVVLGFAAWNIAAVIFDFKVRTLIVTLVSVVVYFGLFAGLAGITQTGWNEVSAAWLSTTIVAVLTFIGAVIYFIIRKKCCNNGDAEAAAKNKVTGYNGPKNVFRQ